MKKTICLLLCVAMAFCVSSCKKGSDNKNGNANSTAVSSEAESSANSNNTNNNQNSNNPKNNSKESTTTPMPKTKASEAVSISQDDALKKLSDFYGSAYHVEETKKKGSVQHYEVRDNTGNLYAKLEVNLKTSNAKETVVHSGEVNEFNLLV